ncbi:MAG: hypothetical protein ERJ68_00080 [Aphanocapsa feldmannii 277cI]|uniref:Uncharacterized protein n=1 Tax=Aphanocapsa feldmannii 277cI TaxID=2507554 RepID=A0A524RWI0_9CHRO|nr:MAG: hypothetical protein ERJ68_00080 [Aphanocapsa feldmannii 277cI]
MAAILTSAGTLYLAGLIQGSDGLYLAWGRGNPAWDPTPPDPPLEATALVAEIGRRQVSEVSYAMPDVNGEIVTPEGSYGISMTPTSLLYFRTSFDLRDGAGEVIREIGLFVGSERGADVPVAQQYLQPDDVDDPGTLMVLQRIPPVLQSEAVRAEFDLILSL